MHNRKPKIDKEQKLEDALDGLALTSPLKDLDDNGEHHPSIV